MTANLAWQSAAQTSISLITSALRVQPIQGGLLVPILALGLHTAKARIGPSLVPPIMLVISLLVVIHILTVV